MTILDLPRTAESLPESHDPAKLHAMLADPALIGFRTEILDEIERLTGVRPEVDQ